MNSKILEWDIFWKLTVIKKDWFHIYPSWDRTSKYLCKCECWVEKSYIWKCLSNWNTKSCWCLKKNWSRKWRPKWIYCIICNKTLSIKSKKLMCSKCINNIYEKSLIWKKIWQLTITSTYMIPWNIRAIRFVKCKCDCWNKELYTTRYRDLYTWKIIRCNKCKLRWKNHPNWKWWITEYKMKIRASEENQKWRKKCLERDWYKCQITWAIWDWKNLVVHHIIPLSKIIEEWWDLFDINNWITLHKDIHNKFHSIYWKNWYAISAFDEFKKRLKWIEVKLDAYAIHSGNFYIEFECNGKPSWLFREEHLHLRWWWHSNWEELLMLDWDELKEVVLEKIEACRANKTNTSKGFKVIEAWWNWGRTKGLLFPVEEMKKIAKHIFKII